jgi:poly(3-hydroxyalkanoate) synthetase
VVRVLGTPIDLAKVDRDGYLVAGDLGRWRVGYRAARLLGGDCRFVLAPGGPVEALVVPDRPVRAGAAGAPDPDAWRAASSGLSSSWWDDHLRWLTARSGGLVDAPPELGGRGLHAIAPTPGDYVRSP